MMIRFILLFILITVSSITSVWVSRNAKVDALRKMLSSGTLSVMPCCYDGLTARLVEQAGFKLTFMTGFGTAAVQGVPDSGLLGLGEMVSTGSIVCGALKSIPCIGDGDTGYGNEVNMKRTVRQYIQAGFAGIMIEDQVSFISMNKSTY